MAENSAKKEHNWLSVIFNVLIPVVILHKLSTPLGPLVALLLALAFPLGYGIYDFTQRTKVNLLSVLGLLNVTVTGGLAYLGIGGFWFSVKEAFFPLLVGAFVLGSAFSKKPFVKAVFLNPQLMDLDKIHTILTEKSKESEFEKHLRTSTVFLSGSFFLSAILNFGLAQRIFTELDPTLDETARAIALNEQIATMTKWGFLVIMIPSFICLAFILWHLLSGIKNLTGLKTEEFLKN